MLFNKGECRKGGWGAKEFEGRERENEKGENIQLKGKHLFEIGRGKILCTPFALLCPILNKSFWSVNSCFTLKKKSIFKICLMASRINKYKKYEIKYEPNQINENNLYIKVHTLIIDLFCFYIKLKPNYLFTWMY